MDKSLFYKNAAISICIMSLLLLVPLALIKEQIRERQKATAGQVHRVHRQRSRVQDKC